MAMLKIGHRVINTDAIAHINLDAKEYQVDDNTKSVVGVDSVQVKMLSHDGDDSDTLVFLGEEAKALRAYFQLVDNVTDVVEMYKNPGTYGYIR